mmetsp:Transcript_7031/g.24775  ORF Transcript_7031/g.24775 Transcript_7031/m.24775 type:complete len:397 (+) Transcript_7031:330-1520(+)
MAAYKAPRSLAVSSPAFAGEAAKPTEPKTAKMHAMWSQWIKVRSFAKMSFGWTRCCGISFCMSSRATLFARGLQQISLAKPHSSLAQKQFSRLHCCAAPRHAGEVSPEPTAWRRGGERRAATAFLVENVGAMASSALACVEVSDRKIDSPPLLRIESAICGSSIQYGRLWTSSGIKTAQPWMNLLNLWTGMSFEESTKTLTHSGKSSASASASLISRTAKGKRVISESGMASDGSLYQRLKRGDATSEIKHKFESMDTRTALVCASWNATRMHCDRTVGTSPLVAINCVTSSIRMRSPRMAASDFLPPRRWRCTCASTSYSPFRSSGTSSGLMLKRSLTLSSPVQESRCVFRSTKTSVGSPVPYHRSRSATAPGDLSKRPWYSSSAALSRYTEFTN